MKMHTPLLTLDPIQEMDHLRGVISTEAISVAGIMHSLQNLIPSIQKNFEGFIKGFGATKPALQLKGNERDFVRSLDGRVYLNLTPLLAHVPEGMIVPYIEYLKELKSAVLHCQNFTQAILNDYSVYVAQIITNRQMKVSTMPLDSTYAKMEKVRADLTANMAKCFKPGSSKSQTTYGEVVGRNADWAEVFQLINEIDYLLNSMRRDDLHKKAEEIDRQLTTIIKQIRNHEFDEAGPEVVTNLSNGAFQAGAELEFFATVYFRATVMNNAVADTMKHVTDVIKGSN